jgi:sec-independent protein translocase protein TatC
MDSTEETLGSPTPQDGGAASETLRGEALAASASVTTDQENLPVRAATGGRRNGPPPPPPPGDDGDDEEDGMLRMSFLEHLEELRSRIIKILLGVGVAFVASLTFCYPLWQIVSRPAVAALTTLGIHPPELVAIEPMEQFNTIWVKIPLLCSAFIASPWILYQVWAFISPGLYRRERRWAAPFIFCSAGLFVLGGVFAYFVAFRYGLTFLLGLGQGYGIRPMVSISTYSDMFFNVVLGVGLVFEMPVLIFFLTLLRIVTPQFLIKNSRYAILFIFVIAAVVTPTPDAVNMMIFATPMVMLFFVGIFASYLLVLSREGREFPWRKIITIAVLVLLLLTGVLVLAITRFGLHLVPHWPFFVR